LGILKSHFACQTWIWRFDTAKGLQPAGRRVLVLGKCAAKIAQ
jgi:hypothetical protein